MRIGSFLRTSAYIGTVALLGGAVACLSQEPKPQSTPGAMPTTEVTTAVADEESQTRDTREAEEFEPAAAADPAPLDDAQPDVSVAPKAQSPAKKPAEAPPRLETRKKDKKSSDAPNTGTLGALRGPSGGEGRFDGLTELDGNGFAIGGDGQFQGREREFNLPTRTSEDALSTFAIDVDTAAYSIARRTLQSERLPTASLVRVEELINYFRYAYEPPRGDRNLFSIQAEGSVSPADPSKHLLRVGIQARVVEDEDRLPANLVFLIDTSCSMTSQDRLDLAKKSLKMAVDRLGSKDRVAITTYAGGVRVVLPPTSGAEKARIHRAIDGLASGGGTAMQSGIDLAYKQAAAMLRPGSITRIIVCSDGDANIGQTTPEQLLARIDGFVKEGVTISTIGFGDGNYKDEMMEKLANHGNGNYFYIDSLRQAERVFSRDLTKMLQDVAQDVKIQVEFDPEQVLAYRLVGYENRNVADIDFRNDKVDAGEIGAGHQVTAIYELKLAEGAKGKLATVRVRAKLPGGSTAKEVELAVNSNVVDRAFIHAPEDFRFAAAVLGGAELLRQSPYASGWSFSRVMQIIAGTDPARDPDRAEFLALMKTAAHLSGEGVPVGMR